jgi:acetylornithine deacetylase
MDINKLKSDAVELLKSLIETPSLSGEEDATADLIIKYLQEYNINEIYRKHNNVWSKNYYFNHDLPTVLLNIHHDTVKPNSAYSKDPFKAIVEGDRLYGLGSNDAGGGVVSLLATFVYFYKMKDLKYNVIVAITGEEENSGTNGIVSVLDEFPSIDFAIVSEPTLMKMAVAEKGLMVIDAKAKGIAGHAARTEGLNSIDIALKDIQTIHSKVFENISPTLGPVKMTVTQINAGKQHNVIPAECSFVIDVRSTDAYTNEEILQFLKDNLNSELQLRGRGYKPSFISMQHPIVESGLKLGLDYYGSPTLSDQAVMDFPSLKIGPGDSARSHTADEFIHISEIEQGIDIYIDILKGILN